MLFNISQALRFIEMTAELNNPRLQDEGFKKGLIKINSFQPGISRHARLDSR